LKDAINEAFRDWVANVDHTHYLFGTVAGPHPFPALVRDLHFVVGAEAREQVLERTGRLPDAVAACVGGGSNATATFAASITAGAPGVFHGARTYVLQDEHGQPLPSHSISAGLDYLAVGPEHAHLADTGRAHYEPVTDAEAMEAFRLLCRTEGIIPAIESAHALAGARRLGERLGPDAVILVNLSGRGDKDVDTAAAYFGLVDEEGRA